MVTLHDLDFKVIVGDYGVEIVGKDGIEALRLLNRDINEKFTTLFQALGDLYEKKGVARCDDPFLYIEKNVHAYFTLQKNPERTVHLIGNISGSSENMAKVYGRLMDSAQLASLRKKGISVESKEQQQAVVQPLQKLAEPMANEGIAYDPRQLHIYLAWDVPLLRF